MEPTTFGTTTVCSALSKLLGEKVDPNVLHLAKSRGTWPLEEEGRGWTRYGLQDVTRLYVMRELKRRGVELWHAVHVAKAKHWWPNLGDQYRYVVFTDGEPELVREKDLAHVLSGESPASKQDRLSSVCSATVVDVKVATELVRAALAELGAQVDLPDHSPAAVRARAGAKDV